jgi:hypothetical protein
MPFSWGVFTVALSCSEGAFLSKITTAKIAFSYHDFKTSRLQSLMMTFLSLTLLAHLVVCYPGWVWSKYIRSLHALGDITFKLIHNHLIRFPISNCLIMVSSCRSYEVTISSGML